MLVIFNLLFQYLSNVVKQLQQESSQKTDGVHCIQSDSITSQHFVSVLEAAFIHGLKVGTFSPLKYLSCPTVFDSLCKRCLV